jgi:hypothetical protein
MAIFAGMNPVDNFVDNFAQIYRDSHAGMRDGRRIILYIRTTY